MYASCAIKRPSQGERDEKRDPTAAEGVGCCLDPVQCVVMNKGWQAEMFQSVVGG